MLRSNMRRCAALALVFAAPVLAQSPPASMEAAPLVSLFSSGRPGDAFPRDWVPVKINDQKKPTVYRMVDDGGVVVLHAAADAAASLLGHRTAFDLKAAPVISWRWKASRLIAGADNAVASKEDSPVRIVLEFDGDRSKLPFGERSAMATAKMLSGRDLPFATLMYVWSAREPVGKVIPNPRISRVQMVVASSGAAGIGTWQTVTRNALDDFRRAFGEEPGRLTAVAVLTDTDNTGESVEGWYGDISFRPSVP